MCQIHFCESSDVCIMRVSVSVAHREITKGRIQRRLITRSIFARRI